MEGDKELGVRLLEPGNEVAVLLQQPADDLWKHWAGDPYHEEMQSNNSIARATICGIEASVGKSTPTFGLIVLAATRGNKKRADF